MPFLVARLNVYADSSGSRVAVCVAESRRSMYDCVGSVFFPLNVYVSMGLLSVESSTRSV